MDLKTILDIKTHNYNDYKSFLNIIKKIIIERKLVMYGGMAIHYALKLKGHEGIYHEDRLPDYDIYSSNFYKDSNEITLYIYNLGYTNVLSVTCQHVTTRTIKMGFNRLCDITQLNYFNKLPTLTYEDIVFVHPLFQRLSLYLVLSMPYAFERGENLSFRYAKDVKRLALLDKYYPVGEEEDNSKFNTVDLKITVDKTRYISGLVAYAIYYKLSKDKTLLVPITYDKDTLTVPSDLPLKYNTYYDYTNKYKKYVKRYKFGDLFPKSRVEKADTNGNKVFEEIVNIKYTIQTINKIDDYLVLNIYNTLLYFLCYYFLTDNTLYLKIIKSLQLMIERNTDNPVFSYVFDNLVGDIENNYMQQEVYRIKIDQKKIPNDIAATYLPRENIEYEEHNINKCKFVKENVTSFLDSSK